MTYQTTSAIEKTVNKLTNIEDFVVKELHGEEVRGPMKWLILILGPNHSAKDLTKMIN